MGLSWLPDTEGGISPKDALTRFLDLLKRILEAKKSHTEDPGTQRAQQGSGNQRGHSFRRTDRRDLRDERQQALLHLLQRGRLHQEMACAIVEDGPREQNWRSKWGPKANELRYGRNAKQKQLCGKHSAGELSTEYFRLRQEYHERYTTAVAKRFRLGPPGQR